MWGIDCSYDELTIDEATRVRAAGVEVFGQCLWTGALQPSVAVNNLRNAHNAGMYTLGYLSVSPRGSAWGGEAHVKAGYDGLPDDVKLGGSNAMSHLALDVELKGLTYADHVQPGINALVARGFKQLIYTSYNAWVNYLGNPTPPYGTSLWNAFWDNDSDYDFARLPFGHDAFVLIGEQFAGGQYVEGQFADRNRFEDAFFVPPAIPRWITAINQEFHDGDRVRWTVIYSDDSEAKVVEA
jgi:hypothetical protein